MATYLLTWNPSKWAWNDIQIDKEQIAQNSFCEGQWSTGVNRRIKPGDRVFLMRLGDKKRGIVASGFASSTVNEDVHWNDSSKNALYVDIKFDTILDVEEDPFFHIEALKTGIYQRVHWTPQASGMKIDDEVAQQLEKDWLGFSNGSTQQNFVRLPSEIPDSLTFHEGSVIRLKVNRYERDPRARVECISIFGTRCSVCGLNFGEKYGEIGEGFIEVHHLSLLSDTPGGHEVDPRDELRPVCSNCHSMIHRKNPPYSIEELRAMLNR